MVRYVIASTVNSQINKQSIKKAQQLNTVTKNKQSSNHSNDESTAPFMSDTFH